MSDINLVGESIEFEQLLNENFIDTMVRGEYLIPDTHPDVMKILMIEARPFIVNTEVMQDKVYLEGQVEYNILYFAKEEDKLAVNSISYNDKFNSQVDIDGAEHRMICEADCEVEHINASIINERKVSVDGIFKIKCTLYENKRIDMVKDIDSSDDVQMQKQSTYMDKIIGNMNTEINGKATVQVSGEKSELGKILNIYSILHKKDIKIMEGRIQCSTFCKINMLYKASESADVCMLEDDIYVSDEFDMENVSSNMHAISDFYANTAEYSIREDETGERRLLDIEVPINVNVKVLAKENIDIIEDAYSPNMTMELNKEKQELVLMLGENNTETIVKDNIYLDSEDLMPSQILNTTGKIFILDKKIIENKILVEGVIRCEVIYRGNDENNSISAISGELPFNTSIEIAGIKIDMMAKLKSSIESIDADIEANTLAVKAVINTSCRVYYKSIREFLVDVKCTEDEQPKKKSSITIYVVQPGDNIWSISKKYYITQEELIKINDMEPNGEIKPGEKLLIPGRAIM